MLRTVIPTVVALALFTAPTLAQRRPAPPPHPFAAIKAFECTFTRFGVARWDGGVPAVITGEDSFTLGITSIDARRNRAQVVGTNATVPASATLTPTGLNVIEQTPGGNFILTTIFTASPSADTWYAVHARHLGDPAAPPSTSQYYGTCEAAN